MRIGNKIDYKRLEELLTVHNIEEATIFDILGRMRVLVDLFKETSEFYHLSPFIKTYYWVTKSVAEKLMGNEHFYNNPRKVRMLDVHFATLYFKPLREYIINGISLNPWNNYFAISKKHNMPFLQLILGINAHINGDLATSLIHLEYKEEHDFDQVNLILGGLVNNIMRYLAFEEKDIFGLMGVVFDDFVYNEFSKIIVGWRSNAYNNAKIIAGKKDKHYFLQKIGDQTEEIALKLEYIFTKEMTSPIKLVQDLNNLQTTL